MTGHLRLRAEGIAWREVDGDVIALGLDSSTYFGTNSSGSLLWKRLADGAERSELVSELMEAFDLDQDQAQTDVDAFVDDLRSRGLLEP